TQASTHVLRRTRMRSTWGAVLRLTKQVPQLWKSELPLDTGLQVSTTRRSLRLLAECISAVTLLRTASSESLPGGISMKPMLVLSIAVLAMPLLAQTAPAPAAPKQVAIVNGEIVTADKLDDMWNNLGF